MKIQKDKLRYILAAVLFLVALVLLAGDWAATRRSGKYPLQTHSILVERRQWGNSPFYVRQDGRELGSVEGMVAGHRQNLAGDQAAFTASRYDEDQGRWLTDLYLVKGKKLIHVADQVVDHCTYSLAADGDGLLYVRCNIETPEKWDLYLYRGGKNIRLFQADAGTPFLEKPDSLNQLTLSPDGSCAAWLCGNSGYFYDGQEVYFQGENLNLGGISRGGTLLYLGEARKSDEEWSTQMFVQRGGDNSTRKALGIGSFRFYNRDLTQVIYTLYPSAEDSENGRDYLLLNGGESIDLGCHFRAPLLPLGTERTPDVLGIETFAGTYFWNRQIFCIGKDYQVRTLSPEDTDLPVLCPDGKTLVYKSGEDRCIYRLNGASDTAVPEQILPKTVREWYALDNGRSFAYVGRDGRPLYYLRVGRSPVLLESRVRNVWAGVGDGTVMYDMEIYQTAEHCVPGGNIPPIHTFYVAKDGKSRFLGEERSLKLREYAPQKGPNWNDRYGYVYHMEDNSYFFDEPWNYGKLWAGLKRDFQIPSGK